MDFKHSENKNECQQAWQSVLGQLQMEMPKASFETWVRDTKAVSLENGILTVATRNTYARDWLENRLASTVDRMLIGILNANISVDFVAREENRSKEDDLDDNQTVDVGEEQQASEEIEDPEKVLEISPEAFDSVYEQIVKPDRAVYLPGYFRRWLRSIGVDLGWMYVSFRQAAYLAGARSGSASHRITAKRLAAMSGITERTYWNRINSHGTWEKLKGLVKISDHGPEWDETSSTPKRLPRRYTVAMTLPLTPIDANSLRMWLLSNSEHFGGAVGVLRAAADAPLEQLISPDATETGNPVTVRKLVRELFGSGHLSDELLDSLASAIQNHIMPQGDLIVVTLYFLQHVLRHLGTGQGWMLTLLRDVCYTDSKTGERRNRVTVRGGYAEIAEWLGMARPKTVWEWLNEKFPASHEGAGKFKNSVLQVYVGEVAKEQTAFDFSGQPRTFDILLEEVPRELLEIALTNPNTLSTGASTNGAIFSIVMARFSQSIGANLSIGMARFSQSDGAIFSIAMARFAEEIGATFTVKNSLTLKSLNSKLLRTNSLSTDSTTTIGTQKEKTAAVDLSSLPSAWDLEWFFKHNKTSAKMQNTLRRVEATGNAMVSWMLYATSADPKSSRLEDPYAFALSQCVEYPSEGPNENFDKLAALPPRALVGMLSDPSPDHPLAWLFNNLMVDEIHTDNWNHTPRYRSLLMILLGEKAVKATRKVETIRIRNRVHYGRG